MPTMTPARRVAGTLPKPPRATATYARRAAVDERALDEPEVRAPERLGGGAQEDGKTEGGEDLGEHGSAQDPPDEPVVDEQTEEGQEEDGEGQRDEGIELQEGPRPERGEHRAHEEFPVGEVDDLHEAEDQGESGGDQRVDESHQEATDQPLDEHLGRHGVQLLLVFEAREGINEVRGGQV